jgi:CRISPR-associated protein Csb2
MKERGTNNLEGQVRAECASRGLPDPIRIEVQLEQGWAPVDHVWSLWRSAPLVVRLADETDAANAARATGNLSSKWRHFRRWRYDHGKRPPVDAAFGLRLSFAEPVVGPIAIGYASHFGLGQFVPA